MSLRRTGHGDEVAQFIGGGECPVCLREVEVRLRCIHHVMYCAPACKTALLAGGFAALSAEEAALAQMRDAEHRKRCLAEGRHELHAVVPA